MAELRDQSVLIVVEGELTPLVMALQEHMESAGADVMVVGDNPDVIADTLTSFEFTAAVVSGDNPSAVAQLQLPTVLFYETDPPAQIVSRLQRVLDAAREG